MIKYDIKRSMSFSETLQTRYLKILLKFFKPMAYTSLTLFQLVLQISRESLLSQHWAPIR